MPRARLRDLGLEVGTLPPGPFNAITDVPGVKVGNYTLTASLAGYASRTVSFSCDLGVDCVVPSIELLQLGSLEISTADVNATAVSNAIFVLSGGGSTPVTQTAPPSLKLPLVSCFGVTFSSDECGAATTQMCPGWVKSR